MKYTEELSWILDKLGSDGRPNYYDEEKYKQNIEFVHSLGLKCDCVGWCKLDLSNPRTSEIFDQISTFCKENGWRARGNYTRKYVDVKSDWYELIPSNFKDNTLYDEIETVEYIPPRLGVGAKRLSRVIISGENFEITVWNANRSLVKEINKRK